jgi:hypothetical protein
MNADERLFYYWTYFGFKTIKGLTYFQRDFLAWITNCGHFGLRLLNPEITSKLGVTDKTITRGIHVLKEQGWITVTKPRSPFRILHASNKAKALLKQEKDKVKTYLDEKNEKATRYNKYLVTQDNLSLVTQDNKSPVLRTISTESIPNKGIKDNKGAKAPSEKHSLSSGSNHSFETFWSVYPRKVGKDAARKAFAKRKPDAVLLEKMLATLQWQCRSRDWLRDDGQFIPHPASWLNAARWEDEPPPPASGQAPRIRGFDGPGPTKEFYQQRLDKLLLIPEDRRTARDRDDIARFREACQ